MDIPVFLFTGFLDSGKTSFIQSLLEDKEFNNSQKTLLIVCEEGEEEYEPTEFAKNGQVVTESVENEEELTEDLLVKFTKKHKPQQILIEYNGMWMNDSLFQALPENWQIAGETLFFDATTFEQYNANIRQLTVNKLRTAELIMFNRVKPETDKMALHKVVRAITRQAQIAYAYENGKTEYDEIVDPLPFDVNAPVITVEDKDYALYYQDLIENIKNYNGKTVEYTIQAATKGRMPKGMFVGGRQLMQCCANDIQFAAFAFKYDKADTLVHTGWYRVKATIEVRFSAIYGKRGPVFNVISIAPCSEPEDPVATFY